VKTVSYPGLSFSEFPTLPAFISEPPRCQNPDSQRCLSLIGFLLVSA
jgi:hypothetical protein